MTSGSGGTEAMNARRGSDDRPGTYEVWFLTFNHAATGQGFWLRFVIEQADDGHGRGELWFARFDPRDPSRTFGVHRRHPYTAIASTAAPFRIAIGASELGHDHTTGAFDGDGHSLAWDLRWHPAATGVKPYPDLAYPLGIGSTKLLAPNPHVAMTGSITVDGERLEFTGATLNQEHVWGTRHAVTWTWAQCGEFADAADARFELVAARLQRGSILTPALVMVRLDLEGEHYALNQFRHLAGNRATWRDRRVVFTARSALVKIEGELTCTPERMVEAPYLDPDGTAVFCANTEIGDATLTISRRSGHGWREVRRLESRGRAHFEVGGRERDPAVTRRHVTVE